MTSGSTQEPWPERPDDEYPDSLWPDDDDEHDGDLPDRAGRPVGIGAAVPPDGPVPSRWGVPTTPAYARNARGRRRGALSLAITAVVAMGSGAGAVLAYRSAEAASTPAAAASQGTGLRPGQGGGPAGQGPSVVQLVIGMVTAVGPGTITIGGGPMGAVKAAVTSATRFTGAARMLSGVRVGDTVQAQVTVANGVARVVSLQDPASVS
jgi:hypothetical protein